MEQALVQVQLVCFIVALSFLGLGTLLCGIRHEWKDKDGQRL